MRNYAIMNPTPLQALLSERGLSLARLAALLGLDKSTITRWSQRRVPAERVNDVSRVTGIPREAIRPDLFAVEAAQ